MILSILEVIVIRASTWLASFVLFITNFVTAKSELTDTQNGNVLALMPSPREQMYVFAKNFFKNPKQVGSIVPSSRFLIDKLIAPVDWNKCKVIVEYGPGIGNISLEILKRMRPDAKMILLELNDDMAEYLQQAFRDPRVISLHRSAEDICEVLRENGLEYADYVVSGIPFSMLPTGVGEKVIKATWEALRPGGKFLIYQYRRKILDFLRPVFEMIETRYQPFNVPPAFVFYAHRT